MKINSFEVNNYKLHIIKTDNNKKINVKIDFSNLLDKSSITIRNLLRMILVQSTSKYPTDRLLNIASEELYDLSYGSSGVISGNSSILSFDVSFIDSKYLNEDILEPSLKFLFDIIINPNISNEKFDEESFKLTFDKLKMNLEMEEENPDQYAKMRFLEFMGENENFSCNPNGYLDDLDKIDSSLLYQEYLKMINNDTINVFVIGNVDCNLVKEIFEKNFNLNNKCSNFKPEFSKYDLFRNDVNSVTQYKDINQSKLFIGFKFEPLTLFEKQYVSYIYSNILGGSSDSKLFTNVREKNSLCYYVYSSVKPVSDLMIIGSGIDYKDFDKAVDLIKHEVDEMKKGNFSSSDIEKAVSIYLSSYEAIYDSQAQMLSNFVSNVYFNFDLVDDRVSTILKVTKEDIVKFASKLHLDTIYLLHGGDKFETDV